MSRAQEQTAPPGCRSCGYVVLVKVVQRGHVTVNFDRCEHPTGPHPMHDPCAWKAEKREGAKE